MKTEVSIAIIENDNGHLLFQLRKKDPYAAHLGLVGGKIENGETNIDALCREVEEETGLIVEQMTFLGRVIEHLTQQDKSAEVILHIFHIFTNGNLTASLSEGEVYWLDEGFFLGNEGKYIPTDWLIVESLLNDNKVVNEIFVEEKEGRYEIKSVK